MWEEGEETKGGGFISKKKKDRFESQGFLYGLQSAKYTIMNFL